VLNVKHQRSIGRLVGGSESFFSEEVDTVYRTLTSVVALFVVADHFGALLHPPLQRFSDCTQFRDFAIWHCKGARRHCQIASRFLYDAPLTHSHTDPLRCLMVLWKH
jgi:hypothetical protein